MRFQRSEISKASRSHLSEISARRVSAYGRILVSSLIMLLLLAVCFWAPLAWADGSAAQGEYSGSAVNDIQGGSAGPLGDTSTSVVAPASVDAGDVGNAAAGSNDASGIKPADGGKTVSGGSSSSGASNTVSTTSSNPITTSSQSNGVNSDASSNVVESASDAQYNLTLICNYGDPGTYWASQADYLARLLSIDYRLTNSGPDAAPDLQVTSATANNGVTIVSPLPDLGTLGVGDSTIFTLKWHVPIGVTRYNTQLTICANCDEDNLDDDSDDDQDNKPDDKKDLQQDDQPGDPQTVIDDTDQAASRNSLSAALDRSTLPSTGFSLLTAILLALVIAPIGAVLLSLSKSVRKLIRVRQK